MTSDQAKQIHGFLVDGKVIEAANLIYSMVGQPQSIKTISQATKVCRGLEKQLLEDEQYLTAATLLWGGDMFSSEPESVRRIFEALRTNARLLIMGGSSLGKSYSAGVWMYLDWRRDPLYTSIKCCGVSEDQVRKHVFAHLVKLHRAAVIPMEEDVVIRDSDMWMGVKDAGYEFGITAIAYKQSQETSGGLKGYKSMPVRSKRHPKFGMYSRLRMLGDECVKGNQRVSMADGSLISIEDIVNNRISGEVLSFNRETRKIEPKKIIGYHQVDRRGREIIDICGVKVTEDHPILSKDMEFVLANDAETCLKIGHEELCLIGKLNPGTKIHRDRRAVWRFVNIPKRGTKGKRQNKIYPRGGAVGLPKMEEGDDGRFCSGTDSRSLQNGVRRTDLQFLNKKSSSIYGDIPPYLPEWDQAFFPGNNPVYGRSGIGGMVHGRWEHLQTQENQNSHVNNINLCPTSSRRGYCHTSSLESWDTIQGQAKQRETCNHDDCGRKPNVLESNKEIYPPSTAIQNERLYAHSQTGGNSINAQSPYYAMQNMREAISENKTCGDMFKGMQQETPAMAGEQKIQETEEDRFVYCIDVEDNHNFFAEGVCLKNCQNWPNGPFKDLNTWVSQIDGPEKVKIALAFNPESTSQLVVQMSEPDEGWNIEELDTRYDWVAKSGWRVCRLDAAICENVVGKKTIYQGLQTYEGYMGYLKAGGDNSANYICFARGFPPMKGDIRTLIPPGWPQSQRGEATFIDNPIIYGAVDLAFMGKDTAKFAVGRWGKASGWKDHMGNFNKFKDRLNITMDKPRHLLQVDQILPLQKHDDTVMMAEEIIGRAKMLNIKPENVIVDKTSIGLGTWSHLVKVWGPAMGVSWNEGATQTRIIAEDKEGADAQVEGVMSEMWWAFRRWIDPTNCAVLINPIIPPQPIHTQLTTRQYAPGKRGLKVEPKEKWKARNGGTSPDEADSLVMLVHAVRMTSEILPGLVEQSTPSKKENSIEWKNAGSMESIESDDSISVDGTSKQDSLSHA